MTDDTSINLTDSESMSAEPTDFAVNFPVSDEEDAEVVVGEGASLEEAMADAKEQVIERREELGLVGDGED